MSSSEVIEDIDGDEQEEAIDEFEKVTSEVRRLLPSIRRFIKVEFNLI